MPSERPERLRGCADRRSRGHSGPAPKAPGAEEPRRSASRRRSLREGNSDLSAERRNRPWLIVAALAFAAGAGLVAPEVSWAQDPSAEREEVRERQGEIASEIDALEADSAEVEQAIADLQENVSTQESELAEAERASDAADEDVEDAEQAVADAEERIADLEVAADQLVVDAYMQGPSSDLLETFSSAETLSDAAVTQALLDLQADNDADVLDQLDAAHDDLAAEEAAAEEAAVAAAAAEEEAAGSLGDLEAALAEQQTFASEVEAALDHKLIEAQNLRAVDEELSRQIQAEQARIARELEEARLAEQQRQAAAEEEGSSAAVSAPAPEDTGGATIESNGDLATVSCTDGGSVTVDDSIGSDVQGLMDRASAQGVSICGSGYRDPQRQIELRRQHCGTSSYAVYEMSSSRCSPPTARPGTSNHEVGLAIDFTCNGGGSIEHGNSCWNFLEANAADFGLYNLPSEPWHWSVDGT